MLDVLVPFLWQQYYNFDAERNKTAAIFQSRRVFQKQRKIKISSRKNIGSITFAPSSLLHPRFLRGNPIKQSSATYIWSRNAGNRKETKENATNSSTPRDWIKPLDIAQTESRINSSGSNACQHRWLFSNPWCEYSFKKGTATYLPWFCGANRTGCVHQFAFSLILCDANVIWF